jgi:hypothetical protein
MKISMTLSQSGKKAYQTINRRSAIAFILPERYATLSLSGNIDRFHKASAEVVGWGKRVFNSQCIDITRVRDDGINGYGFKEIWDRNISQVKPIWKFGLSDSLDEDRYQYVRVKK